ncbi:MAG: metallophosphoesterase [Elusimicrobiota bacterium]|nr:metallophosphoesterase [Elusimicrobiota bacterium]
MKTFIRKHWARILVYGGLGCCALYAFLIEAHWIKIGRLSLSERPSLRVVHISDIHYKGERSYLARIVADVNNLAPDVVCFTGDIAEDTRYLEPALDALSKINAPLYGVPGNHDPLSGASFDRIREYFRKTGGRWLVDDSASTAEGKLLIFGKTETMVNAGRAMHKRGMNVISAPGAKRILLIHYPALVTGIKNEAYDLILAGHSHGGQVRLPFFGALIVPSGVDGYQMGAYLTPAGRLHVSPGLGTYLLPARFFCRPEITLLEI